MVRARWQEFCEQHTGLQPTESMKLSIIAVATTLAMASFAGNMNAMQVGQQTISCGGAVVFTTDGDTADGFGTTPTTAEDAAEAALKAKMITEWGGNGSCAPVCPEPDMDPCSENMVVGYSAGDQTTTPGEQVSSAPVEYKSTSTVTFGATITLACRACR